LPSKEAILGLTPSTKYQRTTQRILIAEDNHINQEILAKFCSDLGFVCDLVDNGEKAVERFLAEKYVLVFMDQEMPVLNGMQATEEIRRKEKKAALVSVPIIAVTGNTSFEHQISCKEAGMDDFLPKPVTQKGIVDCLKKWNVLYQVD